ncbi:MAG: hypothetical protein Q4C70_01290 [Planctomycetia bacterium]|nr:hypothetical protein [Planctomycetia bacterium]
MYRKNGDKTHVMQDKKRSVKKVLRKIENFAKIVIQEFYTSKSQKKSPKAMLWQKKNRADFHLKNTKRVTGALI